MAATMRYPWRSPRSSAEAGKPLLQEGRAATGREPTYRPASHAQPSSAPHFVRRRQRQRQRRGEEELTMTTKAESIVAAYELEFGETYPDVSRLPEQSGIYRVCAYGCGSWPHSLVPAGLPTPSEPPSVIPERLLYIGESENVRSRVAYHERRHCWERELGPGERLCSRAARFPTLGPLSVPPGWDRRHLEAALIDRYQPPCNRRPVHSTGFGPLTVRTSGDLLFDRRITVQIARSPGLFGWSTGRRYR